MKSIVIFLVVVTLALLAAPALAQKLDLRNLNTEQLAELAVQAERMRSPQGQAERLSASVRRETEAWANLGANIGTAVVSAAREVGIAANEFSQTSLGRVVTFVVVYKIMGRDALGVIVGVTVLLFGMCMCIIMTRSHRWGRVEWEYQPMLWGLCNRRVVKSLVVDSDVAWARNIATGVMLVATAATGLNCIF